MRSLGYIFRFRNLQCITENKRLGRITGEANVDRKEDED